MSDFKIDFSGIGVAKAATTWIAHCLGDHPAVCMALGKETNFFLLHHISENLPVRRRYYGTTHHDKGMDWYRQRYSHYQPGQLRGEFSNAYIADPESARLLHEHNPRLKLLCCFRNPVDMVYAGFYQLSRVQPLPSSFEKTLEMYPMMLDYCRYHHNLQPFLARFPREQWHFMLFDDIKRDPTAFFQKICSFLEIDPEVVPAAVNQRVNPRKVLRSRFIRDLRCRIGDFLSSTPTTRKLREMAVKAGAGRMALRLVRMNERPGSVPPMAPETRRRLVERFRPDNDALAEFLGRDLSAWNRID